MLRLVTSLVGNEHELAVVSPPDSRWAVEAARLRLPHHPIPAVDLSLRMDVVDTTMGLSQVAVGAGRLRRAVRRWRPDVVHANTLRAGLICTAAGLHERPSLVVQSHEHLTSDVVSQGVRRVLSRRASAVVAVCDHTARDFDAGLPSPVARRVYISIDHQRFRPDAVEPAPVREELGLPEGTPLLGQVAQITQWKGQDVAIRALAELRELGLDAHLLLVGTISFSGRGVRYDNHAFLRQLHQLVDELGVRNHVHWLGWREDVPALVRAFDLSLLPSQHEPFGTSAAESMAMGTPVLVSSDGGPSEYVVDGESGRVLPRDEPGRWAEAARELLTDEARLSHMSAQAGRAVAGFTDEVYRDEMVRVYEATLDPPDPRTRP